MTSGIQFDPEAIRALAQILKDTDLSEIELVEKDSRIRVARTLPAPPMPYPLGGRPDGAGGGVPGRNRGRGGDDDGVGGSGRRRRGLSGGGGAAAPRRWIRATPVWSPPPWWGWSIWRRNRARRPS